MTILRTYAGLAILPVLILLLFHCRPAAEEPRFSFVSQGREVPEFSAGNALEYIAAQLEFGPRVPGTEAHRQTRDFIVDRLRETAGERNVFVQTFSQDGYDETLELYNIIAAFNSGSRDRILLAAHWDTRPRAEEDPERPEEPIPGADDGGSGVGVLLELARIFSEEPPPVGVDLIFFDGEDYGRPGEQSYYFLGSRYWSQNPPVQDYHPRFGILLDMVGGEHARFPKERYSQRFAPSLVEAVWELARELGYGELFPDEEGAFVSDDHLMVNRHTDIPMINIIHHGRSEGGGVEFPPYWHTHEDDLHIIDTRTLQAVGDVMTEMIYNRIN